MVNYLEHYSRVSPQSQGLGIRDRQDQVSPCRIGSQHFQATPTDHFFLRWGCNAEEDTLVFNRGTLHSVNYVGE
jgi:hypothetical protein